MLENLWKRSAGVTQMRFVQVFNTFSRLTWPHELHFTEQLRLNTLWSTKHLLRSSSEYRHVTADLVWQHSNYSEKEVIYSTSAVNSRCSRVPSLTRSHVRSDARLTSNDCFLTDLRLCAVVSTLHTLSPHSAEVRWSEISTCLCVCVYAHKSSSNTFF